MGESHDVGTGPAGFGGAGCPAAAGAAGLAPAVTAGAFDGLDVSDGGEGLLGVVLVSGCTDPGGEGFTPPGTAG